MTDPELIARAVVSDDRAAFGELVRRHQSAVRHFLRHLAGGDAALADDLAQETFLQAWRSLARFEGRANFTTWLLGIAHNHWRNARRKRRGVALEAGHLATLDPVPSPAPLSDLRHDLGQALRTLAVEEQTTLHLCYQQGLSHSEIADVLQCPLGTVKTHINRGKEKLRPLLAPWKPTP
ncbi:MAG TPA: sigma-70 family RNA polymerase sigma factor [Lacunisphaera sp.]|nr:sigma-70 family RNA polymerase sigma factor [Lacunisphaera sp.]